MSILLESNLEGKKLLRRGKVRDVYDEGNELLIVATDRISAFDRIMGRGIPNKGIALTKLSEFWFLKTRHIFKNHLISKYGDRALRVKKAQRIDIEWIARGYLYGSAWRAYSKGVKEVSGVKLPAVCDLRRNFLRSYSHQRQRAMRATTRAFTRRGDKEAPGQQGRLERAPRGDVQALRVLQEGSVA